LHSAPCTAIHELTLARSRVWQAGMNGGALLTSVPITRTRPLTCHTVLRRHGLPLRLPCLLR
jgi:hypothetical protein